MNELREAIRDVLAGWPIGSGYYSTAIGVDEAWEMADAVMQMLSERETYVADCCGATNCWQCERGPAPCLNRP